MERYLRQEYQLAKMDYAMARNEEERNAALRDLARITNLAAVAIGFEFADQLREGEV